MRAIRLLLLLPLLTQLPACGGGSSEPASSTPTPAPATPGTAGIYDVNYGQFRGVYAMLPDGRFQGLHFVGGSILAGHPHGPLSANNSVSSRERIGWANFIDDAAQVGAQEVEGVFGRSFNARGVDVSITGSMGTFRASATQQKTWGTGDARTLYNDAMPLATLAGAYNGIVRTVGLNQRQQAASDFALSADGRWSTTSSGCRFEGTLRQVGSSGIYEAHASTSGADCRFTAALDGILLPLAQVGGKPQIGLLLDSADNRQTAVFVLDKS